MVRIILGGKLRGNKTVWDSLVNCFAPLNRQIQVYYGSVASSNDFSIPHEFTTTTPTIEHSIFNGSTHPDKVRYAEQWASLYQTYHAFKDSFNDSDIIVKGRNDLLLEDTFSEMVLENTVHAPEKEFHETAPFNSEVVCNDQLVIGYKPTMDKYFRLPVDFVWGTNTKFGIETILREYLQQQSIDLKTFKLNYTRVMT